MTVWFKWLAAFDSIGTSAAKTLLNWLKAVIIKDVDSNNFKNLRVIPNINASFLLALLFRLAEWDMAIAQIELKPAVAEINRSDAQIKVVFSVRRFGKTRLMLTDVITEPAPVEPDEVAVVREPE